MNDFDPIHVYVPADSTDPRLVDDPPEGVIVHRGPRLHPDDLTVIDGVPVTSLSRTLIDMAEVADRDELRAMFASVHAQGRLDLEALAASRRRVEWRPSLAMLDEVIAEFS
jgi:hypothetical protein